MRVVGTGRSIVGELDRQGFAGSGKIYTLLTWAVHRHRGGAHACNRMEMESDDSGRGEDPLGIHDRRFKLTRNE